MPGAEDADPLNNTDCRVTNGDFARRDTDVRVAEFQAFGASPTFTIGPAENDLLFGNGFELP